MGAMAATASLIVCGSVVVGASSGLLMLSLSVPKSAPSALSCGFGLVPGKFCFSTSILRRFCSISAAAVNLADPNANGVTIFGDTGDGDFVRSVSVRVARDISGDRRRFRGLDDGFRNLLASDVFEGWIGFSGADGGKGLWEATVVFSDDKD